MDLDQVQFSGWDWKLKIELKKKSNLIKSVLSVKIFEREKRGIASVKYPGSQSLKGYHMPYA